MYCRLLVVKIYASNNYGQTVIQIWTSDIPSNESIILHPLIFADTGHIAFIYQMINHILCCQYFAVFSKTGVIHFHAFHACHSLYPLGFFHAWRTRIFRSSIAMDQPFYFDSTGSLFFNSTPPLLVILAAEQSLVATSNVNVECFLHCIKNGINCSF